MATALLLIQFFMNWHTAGTREYACHFPSLITIVNLKLTETPTFFTCYSVYNIIFSHCNIAAQ